MSGEAAFEVEGVVIEARPNRTWWVELSNGHKVLAFVAGRAKRNCPAFAPGDKVKLQLSPFDLSEGRIVVGTRTI